MRPILTFLSCLLIAGFQPNYGQIRTREFNSGSKYKVDLTKNFRDRLTPLCAIPAEQDKLKALLTLSIYDHYTGIIGSPMKVTMPPAICFGEKIKFDSSGAPKITIQKAFSLSKEKYFVKRLVKIEAIDAESLFQGALRPGIRFGFLVFNKFSAPPIKHIDPERESDGLIPAILISPEGYPGEHASFESICLKSPVQEILSILVGQLEL
jgi:hypothetical protein